MRVCERYPAIRILIEQGRSKYRSNPSHLPKAISTLNLCAGLVASVPSAAKPKWLFYEAARVESGSNGGELAQTQRFRPMALFLGNEDGRTMPPHGLLLMNGLSIALSLLQIWMHKRTHTPQCNLHMQHNDVG